VDVLVNNAAVSPRPGPLVDIEESVWDKLFEINVKAGLMLLKLCYEHMSGDRGANVLFVSSIAAYNPISPLGAYGVTKTTLLGLTKALAQEWIRWYQGELSCSWNCENEILLHVVEERSG
tara:strand:- start:258 stop:617 length:360 start_codon:yes stop_codon:yes gene_type:complete